MRKVWMFLPVVAVLVSPAAADRVDDDLAAVKRAVGSTVQAEAAPPAEQPAAEKPRVEERRREEKRRAEERRREEKRRAERRHARRGEPQWIRVRIAEKGDKHARVSVNLPLGLVRAIGEDVRIDECGDGGHSLAEVLRSLAAGEHLVDIDDDEATVRVWVE